MKNQNVISSLRWNFFWNLCFSIRSVTKRQKAALRWCFPSRYTIHRSVFHRHVPYNVVLVLLYVSLCSLKLLVAWTVHGTVGRCGETCATVSFSAWVQEREDMNVIWDKQKWNYSVRNSISTTWAHFALLTPQVPRTCVVLRLSIISSIDTLQWWWELRRPSCRKQHDSLPHWGSAPLCCNIGVIAGQVAPLAEATWERRHLLAWQKSAIWSSCFQKRVNTDWNVVGVSEPLNSSVAFTNILSPTQFRPKRVMKEMYLSQWPH